MTHSSNNVADIYSTLGAQAEHVEGEILESGDLISDSSLILLAYRRRPFLSIYHWFGIVVSLFDLGCSVTRYPCVTK